MTDPPRIFRDLILIPQDLAQLNQSFSFLSPSAAIGKSTDSGETIRIGDNERRAGLYILGGSGTGKTELIKKLTLEDIEHGHGVFFLDPHGDAVDELIQRIPEARVKDVICLDVRDREYSFAINLLACRDISDISEREDAFTNAKNVFNKLWENMLDDKPWLQLITQQALRVFIENPDYTLSELPLFLTNTEFRNELIKRTKYYPDAKYFWTQEYNPRQREATLARARTILGDTYYRHIVSQKITTIDFSEIMDQKKILFTKLSANLSLDSKKFIGTTLVSALVHAVLNRPPDKRHQFCIFVDEMQNFTTSDDFAVLFTQARKFGIATTIAHQDRYGQLGDNRPLAGATAGAGNKVVFLLAVNDAQEFAPAFANPPPVVTMPEREKVISQEPVADLLRGHAHPQIRAFVDEYLRIMHERREDLKEEMDGIRIERLDDLDEAALFRLDDREAGVYRDYSAQQSAWRGAEAAIERARGKTAKLLYLFERGKGLRLLIRALNRFLTAVMEGRIAPGQEAFAEFIIEHVRDSRSVPDQHRRVLELYISLEYGDPAAPKVIPLEFAKTHGLFGETVNGVFQTVEDKRRWLRREYMKSELRWTRYRTEEVRMQIAGWKVPSNVRTWTAQVCTNYLYLHHYGNLQEILKPYLTASFTPDWQAVINPETWTGARIGFDELRETLCAELDKLSDPLQKTERENNSFRSKIMIDNRFVVKKPVIAAVKSFIQRYGESGFVVFALLEVAIGRYSTWNSDTCRASEYNGLNMLMMPGIVGKEPFDIFLLTKKINNFLLGQRHIKDLASYLLCGGTPCDDPKFTGPDDWYVERLSDDRKLWIGVYDMTKYTEKRDDVRLLAYEAENREDWTLPACLLFWKLLDDPERLYPGVRYIPVRSGNR
jgi:Helicase HerA, central domain